MGLKQTLLLARVVNEFRLEKDAFFVCFFAFIFKEYLTCVIKSGHVGGRLTAAPARWLLSQYSFRENTKKNPLFWNEL